MADIPIAKENTDINKIRRRLVDIVNAFQEMMDREVNRFKEEVKDLDTEIQEGMSNRVGSGVQPNEARKYAARLKNPVLGDSLADLDGIKKSLIADIATLVGEEFVVNDDAEMGGIIGNATTMNYELSELPIQFVVPPVETPPNTEV